MSITYGIGKPRSFERQMEAIRTERIERREIETLEDIEHQQRRQALAVGRQFQDVQATVIRGNRRDDLAAMASEVLRGKEGAARSDSGDDVVRDRTLVESPRPVFRNRLERSSECWQFDDVAFRRCAALEEKMPGGADIRAKLLVLPGPVPGDTRRDWKSGVSVADRRGERARKRKAAMRAKDRSPGIDGTRNGHGVDRVGGD